MARRPLAAFHGGLACPSKPASRPPTPAPATTKGLAPGSVILAPTPAPIPPASAGSCCCLGRRHGRRRRRCEGDDLEIDAARRRPSRAQPGVGGRSDTPEGHPGCFVQLRIALGFVGLVLARRGKHRDPESSRRGRGAGRHPGRRLTRRPPVRKPAPKPPDAPRKPVAAARSARPAASATTARPPSAARTRHEAPSSSIEAVPDALQRRALARGRFRSLSFPSMAKHARGRVRGGSAHARGPYREGQQ